MAISGEKKRGPEPLLNDLFATPCIQHSSSLFPVVVQATTALH